MLYSLNILGISNIDFAAVFDNLLKKTFTTITKKLKRYIEKGTLNIGLICVDSPSK